MRETYFVSESSQVFYETGLHCVKVRLFGFLLSEEYRETMEKALELLVLKKTSKMLGDLSVAEVIAEEDKIWTNQDWALRAVAAGFRHNAIVLPADIFGKMSIEEVVEQRKVVQVKYFDKLEDAKKWIGSIA